MSQSQEPLDSEAGADAASELNQIFRTSPEDFIAAFYDALNQPVLDFRDSLDGSVASKWVENHTGTLYETPEIAQYVASIILSDATILLQIKEVNAKAWFFLINSLFPFFEVPEGWLITARAGGLSDGQTIAIIMARVDAIDSPEKGEAEENFLEQLFTRARHPQDAYGPLLTHQQRRRIADVVQRFAPNVFHRHQAETMGWRHFG